MFSDGEKIISFAFKIEENKVASKCKENGNQLNYQIMLPVNYTQGQISKGTHPPPPPATKKILDKSPKTVTHRATP